MNIFQKICNKLFGWKYVAFNYGFNTVVRRIQVTGNGDKYAMAYGDLIRPGFGYNGWFEL